MVQRKQEITFSTKGTVWDLQHSQHDSIATPRRPSAHEYLPYQLERLERRGSKTRRRITQNDLEAIKRSRPPRPAVSATLNIYQKPAGLRLYQKKKKNGWKPREMIDIEECSGYKQSELRFLSLLTIQEKRGFLRKQRKEGGEKNPPAAAGFEQREKQKTYTSHAGLMNDWKGEENIEEDGNRLRKELKQQGGIEV